MPGYEQVTVSDGDGFLTSRSGSLGSVVSLTVITTRCLPTPVPWPPRSGADKPQPRVDARDVSLDYDRR
jgi:hypothetical protein